MPLAFNDANTDQVSLVPTNMPVTGVEMTLACWYRVTDSSMNQGTLMYAGDASATDQHFFSMDVIGAGGSDTLRAGTIAAGAIALHATATGIWADNVWSHGVAVFSATNLRTIIADGVAATIPNTTSVTPTGVDKFSVGQLGDATPSAFFSGEIFWPAAWSVALSANDALMLFKGADPWTVRRDALVFYPEFLIDEPYDRLTQAKLTIGGSPALVNTLPPNVRMLGRRGRVRSRIPQLI